MGYFVMEGGVGMKALKKWWAGFDWWQQMLLVILALVAAVAMLPGCMGLIAEKAGYKPLPYGHPTIEETYLSSCLHCHATIEELRKDGPPAPLPPLPYRTPWLGPKVERQSGAVTFPNPWYLRGIEDRPLP
jgi:hypothetical protein